MKVVIAIFSVLSTVALLAVAAPVPDGGTFDIVVVNESAKRPILTSFGKSDVGNKERVTLETQKDPQT